MNILFLWTIKSHLFQNLTQESQIFAEKVTIISGNKSGFHFSVYLQMFYEFHQVIEISVKRNIISCHAISEFIFGLHSFETSSEFILLPRSNDWHPRGHLPQQTHCFVSRTEQSLKKSQTSFEKLIRTCKYFIDVYLKSLGRTNWVAMNAQEDEIFFAWIWRRFCVWFRS